MKNKSNLMSKFLAIIVFLLCLIPLFTSCSAADTPPPSMTPAPSETQTPTNTPTKATATRIPTNTKIFVPNKVNSTPTEDLILSNQVLSLTRTLSPTPISGTPTITVPKNISHYSELQPGSYLLFMPYPSNRVLHVISIDGNVEAEYLEFFGGWIAPGGKEIINIETNGNLSYLYTYDMVTEQIIDVHPIPEDFELDSWSPDKQLVAGNFRYEYSNGVYDWRTDNFIPIADGTFPDGSLQTSGSPVWSPDGKWIAFDSLDATTYQGGAFAINTTCLEHTEPTCWETAIGPLIPDGQFLVAWDPNSRYIANSDYDNAIHIYDFETGQSKTVIEIPYEEGVIGFITWTADGKNIAYSLAADYGVIEADLYLISIDGGEPRLLRENVVGVATWLEVP